MKQAVKDHFQELAPEYVNNFSGASSGKNYEFSERMRIVKEEVSNENGLLLDCACGTGEITSAVLSTEYFSGAVVVDLSSNMLDVAVKNIEKSSCSGDIQLYNVDIFEYCPRGDVKFDVILCLGLIAHTGNLDDLLVHLKSMLSDNGKIILQTSLLDHWGVKVVKFVNSMNYFKKNKYELVYYDMNNIKRSIGRAGLNVLSVKRYCFGFPFGDKISRTVNYWLEFVMRKVSSRKGSEAIITLSH